MATPARADNGAALLGAGRGILPYAILFYLIDFFIWYSSPPGPVADANLSFNLMISSVFIAGFFLINFRRVKTSALEARAQPRVVYVPQPVYVQGPPPGYPYPGYAPPPGYPPYGYPQYPSPTQGALPAPAPAEPVPMQTPPQRVAPPPETWEELPSATREPPASSPPARKKPPGGAP